MADYYPVLAHAVSKLPNNDARTRRDLYEQARGILIEKLYNDPSLAAQDCGRTRGARYGHPPRGGGNAAGRVKAGGAFGT